MVAHTTLLEISCRGSNSVDPGEVPHYVCQSTHLGVTSIYWVKVKASFNFVFHVDTFYGRKKNSLNTGILSATCT